MPLWVLCLNPFVINGENIHCANMGEVRLAGIDVPNERDTSPCGGRYVHHVCDDAGAELARKALMALKLQLQDAQWEVLPVARDRVGRMRAMVRIGSVDLSCYQLSTGNARYASELDPGGRVSRTCADLHAGQVRESSWTLSRQ